MKKLVFYLVMLAAFCAASCGKGPENLSAPTLDVKPSSLTFDAVSASAQTVEVTAANVEWELHVPATVAEWLHADKSPSDANVITVTVSDNLRPEKRTASFIVRPVGSDDVKPKTVTVIQEAADVEYKFDVAPALLTFEAGNTSVQEVTVTAEGGLTWRAEAEGEAATWITVNPKEGKIEVSVSDNPQTSERMGNIVVIPSEERVGKRVVRVVQKELILPPSLSIDVDDPENGLVFMRNGLAKDGYKDKINVTAVNVNWDAKAVDADNEQVHWMEVMVNKQDGLSNINFDVKPNPEFTERVAYIVITTDKAEITGFKVKITQEAAEEYHSTLTDHVDVSDVTQAYALVYPNQEWDDSEEASGWTIRFWPDGILHDTDLYTYSGTGGYMEVEFNSLYMEFNDEGTYSLTEGVYTIAPSIEIGNRLAPMHITAGYPGFFDWQHFASWYFYLEDDVQKGIAPLTEGTVTVSKEGGRYKFAFECKDDLGFKISGTFIVDVEAVQQGMPSPPPPITDPNPASLQ